MRPPRVAARRQAGAVQLGIARALVRLDETLRAAMGKEGFSRATRA